MISKRENLPTADPGMDYQREEDWRERSNCKGTDPESFFAESPGGRVPAAVLSTCAACPADVVQSCLDWALTTPEKFGVWGGATPEQRRRMKPGTVAPILTRPRCKTCGGVTSPRRVKCDGCIETADLERKTRYRQANQRAIEEKSA